MLKNIGRLIIWTVLYAAFAAALFHFVFDFDIWSRAAWRVLNRSVIRGFSGFAFGFSLLAVIPVYLASAWRVIKNSALPFPVPNSAKKNDDENSDAPAETDADAKLDFPDDMPDELKKPYIRIHSGQLSKNAIEFVKKNNPAPPPTTTTPAEESDDTANAPDEFMPLPDSFDAVEQESADDDSPVFKDVEF
jgi:hypothetical protein